MIALSKSKIIPAKLQNVAAPTQCDDIDRKIYGDHTVKERLWLDQHKKCAYCERRRDIGEGDVEHYRPKATYYWLAYEWTNLLYSCKTCNVSYKRSYFPLIDESKRSIESKDCSNEEPALINPYYENPADFLQFRNEYIVPKHCGGSQYIKAKETIFYLGLNSRNDLKEDRRRTWNDYRRLLRLYELAKNIGLEGEETDTILVKLESMKSLESEFSGMIINQR